MMGIVSISNNTVLILVIFAFRFSQILGSFFNSNTAFEADYIVRYLEEIPDVVRNPH